MKVIIDIDEEQYEFIKQGMPINKVIQFPALMEAICGYIADGTPLDEVKAEIEKASFEHYMEFGEYIGEDCRKEKIVYLDNILEIIGKAESEETE